MALQPWRLCVRLASDGLPMLEFGLPRMLPFVGLATAWLTEASGGRFPVGLSLGVLGGVQPASNVGCWSPAPGPTPAGEV